VAVAPRHGSLNGGVPRSTSGSLAKFTAIRRASSLVSSLAAERRPGTSSKYKYASVCEALFAKFVQSLQFQAAIKRTAALIRSPTGFNARARWETAGVRCISSRSLL
jgi:hypothetical protein